MSRAREIEQISIKRRNGRHSGESRNPDALRTTWIPGQARNDAEAVSFTITIIRDTPTLNASLFLVFILEHGNQAKINI